MSVFEWVETVFKQTEAEDVQEEKDEEEEDVSTSGQDIKVLENQDDPTGDVDWHLESIWYNQDMAKINMKQNAQQPEIVMFPFQVISDHYTCER